MCMYVHNEVCICNGMYWNLVTWELTSPCVGLLSFQSKHQALNWLTRQSLMELWTTLFAIRGGKDSCLLLDEYTTLDCWWAPNTHTTCTHYVFEYVVHYLLHYYTPVCANDESHWNWLLFLGHLTRIYCVKNNFSIPSEFICSHYVI